MNDVGTEQLALFAAAAPPSGPPLPPGWDYRPEFIGIDEEAALVAVIAALGSGPAAEQPKPRSTWADPAHRMRTTLPHGPGAWRSSGLPH